MQIVYLLNWNKSKNDINVSYIFNSNHSRALFEQPEKKWRKSRFKFKIVAIWKKETCNHTHGKNMAWEIFFSCFASQVNVYVFAVAMHICPYVCAEKRKSGKQSHYWSLSNSSLCGVLVSHTIYAFVKSDPTYGRTQTHGKTVWT